MNQLTKAEYPDNKTTEYTYDPVGDRTGADGINYTYNDVNRHIQAGTSHDPNGNLMSVGEAVYYNYDSENRQIGGRNKIKVGVQMISKRNNIRNLK